MGQFLSRFWGTQTEQALYVQYNPEDKTAVLDILDDPTRDGFKWRVWWVAASGFFTTSYCIFSTNVVSPALSFVYPHNVDCNTASRQPFIINMATLTGTIVGMIVFGCLADLKGRKSLYGLELLIVIIGTIGLVQSSTGYNNSMNIYGWIGFWRFVQGIGLGAEYPLSATIAAEWSSTKTRGRMMASVFLMQSVGQITAYGVSIIVVKNLGPKLGLLDHDNDEDAQQLELARGAVDAIWRVILSVGALPALIAIVLRRLLPETPRFLAEHASVKAAMETTGLVFNAHPSPVPVQQHRFPSPDMPRGYPKPRHSDSIYPDPTIRPANFPRDRNSASSPISPVPIASHAYPSTSHRGSRGVELDLSPRTAPIGTSSRSQHDQVSDSGAGSAHGDRMNGDLHGTAATGIWADLMKYIADAVAYLRQNNRWRAFFGVIVTWYLLDLSVYGLGLDSPKTIATMYLSAPTGSKAPCPTQEWRTDPAQPNITVYDMLIQNTLRNLQTVTTGTLPGSLIILFAIDYVPRATWMGWTFAALAGLFAITGGTLFIAYESDKHAMTLVFYVLTQLLNNLGPNTMTWILPAELFTTRYRATFYGIAAAAGKLGAITIQVINTLAVSGQGKSPFAGMLLGLCPAMLLGAFFSWVWVPEVQEARVARNRVDDDEGESSGIRSNTDDEESQSPGSRRGTGEALAGQEGRTHGGDQSGRRRGAGEVKEVRAFLEGLVLPNRTLEDIAEDPARGQIIGVQACVANACGGLRFLPRLARRRGAETGDVVDGHEMHLRNET